MIPGMRSYFVLLRRAVCPEFVEHHPLVGVPADEVFVSEFDLNLEHGQIERPWKPVIRFVAPVVGVVSRDRKHLAALAASPAHSLCQAWHDCMHINSDWGTSGQRRWRLKIYALENDPAKLLETVAADFPEMQRPRDHLTTRNP